jgi:hypothetical protein
MKFSRAAILITVLFSLGCDGKNEQIKHLHAEEKILKKEEMERQPELKLPPELPLRNPNSEKPAHEKIEIGDGNKKSKSNEKRDKKSKSNEIAGTVKEVKATTGDYFRIYDLTIVEFETRKQFHFGGSIGFPNKQEWHNKLKGIRAGDSVVVSYFHMRGPSSPMFVNDIRIDGRDEK